MKKYLIWIFIGFLLVGFVFMSLIAREILLVIRNIFEPFIRYIIEKKEELLP